MTYVLAIKAREMPFGEACLYINDESCQNPYKPVDVTSGSSEDELKDNVIYDNWY